MCSTPFLLHMNVRALARQDRQQRQHFEARFAEVLKVTQQLRREREEAAQPTPAPAAAQAVNSNKRGQVLRGRRRGENPEITAALSTPRKEGDLLRKAHQMSLDQVERGTTQAAG